MTERNIRLSILSHLIAAGAGGLLIFALAYPHRAAAPEPEGKAAPPPPPVVEVPKIPLTAALPPPLDRAALIAAAAAASDAVASGAPLPEANAALIGRSFNLRIPFGCGGPAKDLANKDRWAGWNYDAESRALKLVARGQALSDAAWIKPLAGAMPVDAVEGFWLRRPWTTGDQCLTGDMAQTDAILDSSAQKLAIAQFYAPDGPRTLRRGDRPYASTIKLKDGEAPSANGYQIGMEGKISGFADGQPVHCVQDSSATAPRCVIAVTFERVAFLTPGDTTPIVEWR